LPGVGVVDFARDDVVRAEEFEVVCDFLDT
jgi:hypothetical protein